MILEENNNRKITMEVMCSKREAIAGSYRISTGEGGGVELV